MHAKSNFDVALALKGYGQYGYQWDVGLFEKHHFQHNKEPLSVYASVTTVEPLLGDRYIANLLPVRPEVRALTLKLLHGLGHKNPADISRQWVGHFPRFPRHAS